MQLRRLKFAARIRMCFALVIAALIGMGTFAVYQAKEIREASLVIEQDALPGIALGDDITLAFMKARFGVFRLLSSTTGAALSLNYNAFIADTQEFTAARDAYRPNVTSEHEQNLFSATGTLFEKYGAAANKVHDLLKRGLPEEANSLVNGEMAMIAQAMNKALSELEQLNDQAMQSASTAGQNAYQVSIRITVIVIVLVTLCSILIAHCLTESIARPVA